MTFFAFGIDYLDKLNRPAVQFSDQLLPPVRITSQPQSLFGSEAMTCACSSHWHSNSKSAGVAGRNLMTPCIIVTGRHIS